MFTVGSGRHRRNGFEAKISNENLYTVLLHFSNEDLLGSDKIKPNSLHIVDTANLGLSLKTQKKPRNGQNGQNFNSENVVKFTLYQLMEESDIKPEAAIAMESQDFIINEDFENKIIFDASEIVQSWFMDETSNQGLRIECDLCHKFGIQFTNEDIHLSINVESTDNQKDMTRRATLKGDWTSLDKKVDCPSIQHKRKPRCCRESMIVDFSKISGEFLKILNLSLCPD